MKKTNLLTIFTLFFFISFTQASEIQNTHTLSRSAKNIEVTFSYSNQENQCYANLHNGDWTQEWIAPAVITQDTIGIYSAKTTTPDYALNINKVLIIQCGETVQKHKIPQPPTINLNTLLTSKHTLLFDAEAFIENHEENGKCWTNNNPASFDLLNLQESTEVYFYSNYFHLTQSITEPVYSIRAAIFCQNSGGITTRGQVWGVAPGENTWRLFEDITSYQ
ncbi:hypothetical protein [Teredinibacter sp. KSP-S5-2]|uniref:hypothetical protein n=1 Tax=Teredinibacter sp. KSP-S5-2 TaxID=3034506 RepID=UPI0029348AF4|nr:hypothetical protein [Teredinibacter sp. KSP-S5-2]WNO09794.1 hypothetical protein P5V12_01220 [Teredinibacter sp. KSP-S5-2]